MRLTTFLLLLAVAYPLSLAAQGTKAITLESIYRDRLFTPRMYKSVMPLASGRHFCVVINDSINIYEYKTGRYVSTLISPANLILNNGNDTLHFEDFQISSDESKILLAAAKEPIYRHSYVSEHYIFDRKTGKISQLSPNGKQSLADFSPDGSMVAFVRGNNIFIKNLASGTETMVTDDGRFNHIINGAPDWVYEEEFGFSKGFFWSPDSRKIAYYRFDERNVKEFAFTSWGALYPEEYRYKYPKAGEENSVVEVFVYDLESGLRRRMDTGDEKDIYLPRMQWTPKPGLLAIQRLNRRQDHLEVLIAESGTGKTKVVYQQKSEYYIEITNDMKFLAGGLQFVITSEESGNNHIYLVDVDKGTQIPLTSGSWDVVEVLGVDEARKKVYYISAETSPLHKMLYSINLDGRKKEKISQRTGSNNVQFSADFSFSVNRFSNADTPPYTTVNDYRGNEIRVLEDNSAMQVRLKDYGFSPVEFFSFGNPTITLPDGSAALLNGWMIKPPAFDSTKKYPVLMYVYGGPGAQDVYDGWLRMTSWFQLMAQQGYIVACVDNRGTGNRGAAFRQSTYMQLGKLETEDQIAAAKYLGGLPYVDASRIGIFGWSYGGYMSSLCITKGADVFKAAVAVAPVTNWRYYDNIYTERYMRKPQENPAGYDDNSPINHVGELSGKFLLIHGTADDNVHLQNSMDLISALTAANKPFEMQLYVNENHGIRTGPNSAIHVFGRITDFILKNL